MTKKHAHHGDRPLVVDTGTQELPLFSRPNADARKLERDRLKERLLPIVTELADRHGPEGITASEVISEAITRGIVPGPAPRTSPRRDAWLGPWLQSLTKRGTLAEKRLRLEGGGSVVVRRASDREKSHGNRNVVYVAPRYAA